MSKNCVHDQVDLIIEVDLTVDDNPTIDVAMQAMQINTQGDLQEGHGIQLWQLPICFGKWIFWLENEIKCTTWQQLNIVYLMNHLPLTKPSSRLNTRSGFKPCKASMTFWLTTAHEYSKTCQREERWYIPSGSIKSSLLQTRMLFT